MFFFIIPVGVDYRARRYPVVTFTLMGICVAIYLGTFIARLSQGESVDEWMIGNLWLVPAEHRWWTYITSLFVHAGFFHVAGNMVYLFLFGSCVEDFMGRAKFIVFYLLCGIGACLAHIAFSPAHFSSEVPLGGASGAISGCIGGFLLLLARTRIEFKWVFFLFFRVWSGEFFLPAWLVITGWFLQDLAGMVLTLSREGGGTAFSAHVGGTLVGIGLMSLEKVRLKYWPEPEEEEEEEAVARPVAQPAVRPVVRIHRRTPVVPVAAPVLETSTIYLAVDGVQSGPFTLSQILQMFSQGTVPEQAYYWQEGMEDWRSAEELRQPGIS